MCNNFRQVIPQKIRKDDTIRIIAPSRSLSTLNKEIIKTANKRFKEMGLQ